MRSHHRPKPKMVADARMPRPGAAKQEKWEEIDDEAPRTLHEGQRPFGEERLSREGGGHNRRRWRCQQQRVAPKGEEDEQAESDQDAEQFDDVSAHDVAFKRARK